MQHDMKTALYKIIFCLVLVLSGTEFSYAHVVITEVLCNPSDGASARMVKVQNAGGDAVDVSAWKLQEGADVNKNKHGLANNTHGANGDFSVAGGETFVIAKDPTKYNTQFESYYAALTLSKESDAVRLLDAGKNIIDSVTYTKGASGTACYSRSGGSTATPTTTTTTTPTTTSTTSATTTIVQIITKEKIVTKYKTVTIEPPRDIFLRVGEDRDVSTNTNVNFVAEVYDSKGETTLYGEEPEIVWSFGDGDIGSGNTVTHNYQFSGVYIVTVSAKAGHLYDKKKITVHVYDSEVAINFADDYSFVEIFNRGKVDINLNGWRVRSGYQGTAFSTDTIILAEGSMKFDVDRFGLTRISGGDVVKLYFPNRKLAADSESFKEDTDTKDSASSTLSTGVSVIIGTTTTTTADAGIADLIKSISESAEDLQDMAALTKTPELKPNKVISITKNKEIKIIHNTPKKVVKDIKTKQENGMHISDKIAQDKIPLLKNTTQVASVYQSISKFNMDFAGSWMYVLFAFLVSVFGAVSVLILRQNNVSTSIVQTEEEPKLSAVDFKIKEVK